MAVRTAMGASRLRIVRQLLTESVGLALLGGAAGIALASASVRAIQWLQPPGIPRLRDIAVDGQMLLFTLILCVASGLLFGLAPAMGVGRLNLYGTLKDAGRGSAGTTRGNRLRRRARRRRARALGRRAGRRRPARPQLRSTATRGSRVRSARRPDARADDDRPEVRRRKRRAAHLRGILASPGRVARRRGVRRRDFPAAQRLLRVGADHRGGARATTWRAVHQRRSARRLAAGISRR